jgi:hypothetical protein
LAGTELPISNTAEADIQKKSPAPILRKPRAAAIVKLRAASEDDQTGINWNHNYSTHRVPAAMEGTVS